MAFGGGGPIHAASYRPQARRTRGSCFPAGAGVMSAFGMLACTQNFEVMRAYPRAVDRLPPEELARILLGLEDEVSAFLLAGDVPQAAIRIRRRADMRYRGQGYDIEVELPTGLDPVALVSSLPGLFIKRYRDTFHAELGEPIEIVSLKVEAIGPEPPGVTTGHAAAGAGGIALKGTRPSTSRSAGSSPNVPCTTATSLRLERWCAGRCWSRNENSTCLLHEGDVASVDASGNMVAEIAASQLSAAA